MQISEGIMKIVKFFILLPVMLFLPGMTAAENQPETTFVSYEKFGARGDGKTDDQAAIAAAHAYANKHRLPVKVRNNGRYYIGGGNKVIEIMTDTDFGNAEFIIDDTNVKKRNAPVFGVRSRKKPYNVNGIASLKKNQTVLPVRIRNKALLVLQNNKVKHFIRYGVNANKGAPQTDIVIASPDGKINPDTPLAWDFPQVTSCIAYPIDKTPLTIRGGIFTTIANQEPGAHRYYSRNISITRSNVLVSGLTHKVIEPTKPHSFPYSGFITITNCCNVTVENCVLTGRKVHKTVKPNSKSITTGTYDISISRAANVKFINCSQTNDILDSTYWGIMGSNYCKNLEYDRCRLSRFDAHCGVYNAVIRNSILGRAGISVTGFGTLLVENTTVYGRHFIGLRVDYGSFWRGNIIIRNCTFIPGAGRKNIQPVIIGGSNNFQHNFGYRCFMPDTIEIDNLQIKDHTHPKKYKGPMLLSAYNNDCRSDRYKAPYPCVVPRQITVRDLQTASGKKFQLSANEYLFKKVEVIRK